MIYFPISYIPRHAQKLIPCLLMPTVSKDVTPALPLSPEVCYFAEKKNENKKELPCGPQSTIERPELIEKHKIEKEGGDTRAYRLTICMSQKRS